MDIKEKLSGITKLVEEINRGNSIDEAVDSYQRKAMNSIDNIERYLRLMTETTNVLKDIVYNRLRGDVFDTFSPGQKDNFLKLLEKAKKGLEKVDIDAFRHLDQGFMGYGSK